MMRRRLLLTLMLTSVLAVEVDQTFSQTPPEIGERVLAGNWKVILQPYSGPEFESMPLQVIAVVGVSSHNGNVFWIRERRLRNRSDQRVLKASFTAFVYREQSPETLLFQYPLHTVGLAKVPVLPGTEWPAPCADRPKYYCPFAHGIPGAPTLLAPLVKDGALEGEYRIAIGVSKVWFEDGSIWELPSSQPQAQPNAP